MHCGNLDRDYMSLQTVFRALLPASRSVTAGHITLLKHRTLTALMQRLDATIFERLLAGERDLIPTPREACKFAFAHTILLTFVQEIT